MLPSGRQGGWWMRPPLPSGLAHLPSSCEVSHLAPIPPSSVVVLISALETHFLDFAKLKKTTKTRKVGLGAKLEKNAKKTHNELKKLNTIFYLFANFEKSKNRQTRI